MALRNVGSVLKFKEFFPGRFNNVVIKRNILSAFNWEPKDVETHTGQKWDDNDYRMCRFINKTKQVNPNWAINLIAEAPPVGVDHRVIACDGGSGPTGHPKVYINLDKPGYHSCMYCGIRYYKKEKHHEENCN